MSSTTSSDSSTLLPIEDDFESERVVKISSKGKGDYLEYQIEVNIGGQWIESYVGRGKNELKHFVEHIEQKCSELREIRFYHKDHLITLAELQMNVWALTTSDSVYVVINGVKYVADLNNEKNREGNQAFREDNFEKAVRLYTASMKRYPMHVKPLANRSLCYFKLERPVECIKDCTDFFTMMAILKQKGDLQPSDEELVGKGYFRRARSYYQLAEALLATTRFDNQTSSDSDNDEQLRDSTSHSLATDNSVVDELIKDMQEEEIFTNVMTDEEDVIEPVTLKALKLFKKAASDFMNIETSEFEKKADVNSELESTLNQFVTRYPRLHLQCCPMCRSQITEENKIVATTIAPREVVEALTQSGSSTKDANELKKVYPFFCTSCSAPYIDLEDKFVRKVWKPFTQNPTGELKIEENELWLNNYAALVTWKHIISTDFYSFGFMMKNNTGIRKTLSRLRKILLALQTNALVAESKVVKNYIYISPTTAIPTLSEALNNVLLNVKFAKTVAFDPSLVEVVTLIHTKIGLFHFCTFTLETADLYNEWPNKWEISRQVSTITSKLRQSFVFTIPKESERTPVAALMEHLQQAMATETTAQ